MEDLVYLINRLVILAKDSSMSEVEMEIIKGIWNGLLYKDISCLAFKLGAV